MKQMNKYGKSRVGRDGQRGGMTIFSAALILILMTMVLVYATRVSVFESRLSGNEVRQKEAFHVAEAALDRGVMYLSSNANVLLSSRVDAFADGTAGGFDKDGWFSAIDRRWVACQRAIDELSDANLAKHPCGGDIAATPGAFFYDTDNNTGTIESLLPVNETDFPVGSTARMSALICFVDLDNLTDPCSTSPSSSAEEANTTLVITLLAYGYSDCTDTNRVSTCTGEATIAKPMSTFKHLSGPPALPLVAKGAVPLDGTFEVVGNPNGGGVGVPLTTWVESDASIQSVGSWQTCEMEEWYHANERPADVICDDNNCLCGAGGNDTSSFLSWRKSDSDFNFGVDILRDDSFPPDLFYFFFGKPRESPFYLQVKAIAQPLDASECESLGPGSNGLIWINGETCNLKGNRVSTKPSDPAIFKELTIGSPLAPVILVSAANTTMLNGGVNIFGVLYIFDGDPAGSEALLASNGGATVYGAVIVDGEVGQLGGNFQIVYNEDILIAANAVAGVGSLNGGWRDFGLPEISWPDIVVVAP